MAKPPSSRYVSPSSETRSIAPFSTGCYGFVGPIATTLKATYDAEGKYYQCLKAGMLAYLGGHAPAICVEFARKALLSDVRPTFYEVEEAVSSLPAAA